MSNTETKVSTITKEQLLEHGWKETIDPLFRMEKILSDIDDEDFDEDEGVLKMVLHGMYNEWMFGLQLPDGGRIDINPSSIEELNLFEALILSYDPPY